MQIYYPARCEPFLSPRDYSERSCSSANIFRQWFPQDHVFHRLGQHTPNHLLSLITFQPISETKSCWPRIWNQQISFAHITLTTKPMVSPFLTKSPRFITNRQMFSDMSLNDGAPSPENISNTLAPPFKPPPLLLWFAVTIERNHDARS